MKKLITLLLALTLAAGISGCGNNAQTTDPNAQEEKNPMSGINSEVSSSETDAGIQYVFDGYFTTVAPAGIYAEDNSINADAPLFSFSENEIVCFDVTYYEGTSEQEVAQKAASAAKVSGSSAVKSVSIDKIEFHGVKIPNYGMTRYFGYVNGSDVVISVYTEPDHAAFQAFVANTVFAAQ